MAKKRKVISYVIIATLIISFGVVAGYHLKIHIIDNIEIPYYYKSYNSVEDAITAEETARRENYDESLDVCPPYNIKHTFEYEGNTIVFCSFCDDLDGEESNDLDVTIFKHNKDGTYSYNNGYATFVRREASTKEYHYYFTSIDTYDGEKTICFLYLPADSDKEIYFDGVKAEKLKVTDGDKEYYICYAVSDNLDYFITNLFTDISERHTITIK